MINTVIEINKCIIYNANLLLLVDKFFKEFVGYKVALLINFFSRYDQVKLDVKSRDLTAFQTPLGLLRITTLL